VRRYAEVADFGLSKMFDISTPRKPMEAGVVGLCTLNQVDP
jgi:hypothetical protein